MSGILTLFGEELQPEDINAVGKSRAKAKPKEQAPAKDSPAPKAKEESATADKPAAESATADKPVAKRAPLAPPVPPRQPEVRQQESATADKPATAGKSTTADKPTQTIKAKVGRPKKAPAVKSTARNAKHKKAVVEAEAEPLPESFDMDKQYYSIGEVSQLFRIATSHIRFWTKEFDMRVRTTRKGDRLYTPEQIKELRVIYNLVKERGYTIKGAKEKLKTTKKTAVETVDLKQSLLQLRNKLLSIRNELS
jgi:DNA-binding transcriptional MerR regulator